MSEFEKWIEGVAMPGNRLHEPGMWSALEKAFKAGQTAERSACIEIIEDHDNCDVDGVLNALNARES